MNNKIVITTDIAAVNECDLKTCKNPGLRASFAAPGIANPNPANIADVDSAGGV